MHQLLLLRDKANNAQVQYSCACTRYKDLMEFEDSFFVFVFVILSFCTNLCMVQKKRILSQVSDKDRAQEQSGRKRSRQRK